MALVLGVPPVVLQLVQQGLLERAFHDGLYPALLFRAEAMVEDWPANSGTQLLMSRPGLLAPATTPLVPGNDPIPQALTFEQWVATLNRWAGTIDIHMPTSAVANASLFLRNIQQLGLQAGQTLNRLARNNLMKPYLSGQTLSTVLGNTGDTVLQVAALNGFTDVVTPSGLTGSIQPTAVSPSNPLAITIQGVTGTRNVVGTIPNNPNDPTGPGTLLLGTSLGASVAVRSQVLSSAAPKILRSGGGTTIDAVTAADTFVLQDAINAVNYLRRHNVQPHEDGYYHGHLSPDANAQINTDPAWRQLFTALPASMQYAEGFIGHIQGIAFFLNTESPDDTNTGALTPTSTLANYATDISAEVDNNTGVRVGRILITGRGALYERWLDEDHYTSEAGITGKLGEFDIVNAGISVATERIQLKLRAPLNRLQDTVAATWACSTSFPVPSDITATTGPQRFKRAIVIEHALNS